MSSTIKIGNRLVGENQPCFVIAEIGINHNGDLDIAKKLIEAAVTAGCDAVKFQKRTPELCVPPAQRNVLRETPWGTMTYFDYRQRVEFGQAEYAAIAEHCRTHGIAWFASPWDEPSVDFLESFAPVAHKVPSALITNERLLRHVRATGRPLLLSTGMSTMDEVRQAVAWLGSMENLVLLHCNSSYPCAVQELNLRMIETLRREFPGAVVGYSGHEVGLATTAATVALGARVIERHITLDRAMWGTDQAASVEPQGMAHLVKYIHAIEKALGDGVKRVYPSEEPIRKKLRYA